MSYNFQDILRQALSGGLGQADYTDPTGQRSQESWTDPATGLTVMKDGNGYRFVQPGEMNTAWDMGADGSVGDARQYKTAGLGSQLGEFTREGAIPLALAALGANGIGNMLGQANGFSSLFPGTEYGASYGGASMAEQEAINAALNAGGAAPAAGAGSAAKAALYGAEGYGPGMSGAATAAYDAGIKGSGLLGSLGEFGSLAKIAAPILGAVAGAKGTPGTTTSQTRSLDPRLDAIAFGPGGLLSNAQEWWQKNKSGQNDTMKQASQQLTGLLTDPALKTAIYSQGATGQRLLNQPMAGNPFTRAGFNGTNWWGG